MKKFLLLMVMAFVCLGFGSSNPITKDGYYDDIKLCGKVKIVQYGADIDVKVVDYAPDLDVKICNYPSAIGEWKFVEHGEDFTVKFVDYAADINIRFVDYSPGVR